MDRPAPLAVVPKALTPGRGGVVPPLHSRFKPGQSGNPGGRPKGRISVTEAARMILGGKTRCPRRSYTDVWELAQAWVQRAKKDDAALASLLDRVEGKVTQPVRNDVALVVEFEYVRKDVPNDPLEDGAGAGGAPE